jgi:hypothetical protein
MPVRDEKPEKLRVDHVQRAKLPWRDVDLTECGLPVEDHPVITRDTFAARIREWGKERTRYTVCMTCATTAPHYSAWETDPVSVMKREAERCGWYPRAQDVGRDLFTRELRAMAALIEAHREEFDGYVQGLAETSSLATARKRKVAGFLPPRVKK